MLSSGCRVEVGQGIRTVLAMVVADEIDARLGDVAVPLEDARQDLGRAQSTGGSPSRFAPRWDPVRSTAGEAAPGLITAAAERWDLPARDLTTRDTAVCAPDGREGLRRGHQGAARRGDPSNDASASAAPKVDATFWFAFVNQAPMEVGSAAADVQSGSAEVWVARQSHRPALSRRSPTQSGWAPTM